MVFIRRISAFYLYEEFTELYKGCVKSLGFLIIYCLIIRSLTALMR